MQKEDRAALKALDAKVLSLDVSRNEAVERLAAAEERRAALDGRLAQEQARPAPVDQAVDDLAAALAANPAAAVNAAAAERLGKSRAATASHAAAADAITGALEGATAKVDQEIEQFRAQIEQLTQDRDAAWCELIRASYDAVLRQFRAEWGRLHDAVFSPLMALADVRLPGGNFPIVAGDTMRVSRDSRIVLMGRGTAEYLLASKEGGGVPRRYDNALPSFLAQLRS